MAPIKQVAAPVEEEREEKGGGKTNKQCHGTYLSFTARRTLGGGPIRDTIAGCAVKAEELGTNARVFLLIISAVIRIIDGHSGLHNGMVSLCP